MGLFSKSKKHSNPSSPSATPGDSPGSPSYYGHHTLRTSMSSGSEDSSHKNQFQLPKTKRASGFFDLNLFSESSDIFSNPPPPALQPTHKPDEEPSYIAQSAIKNHNRASASSSFYESIPQMSSRVVSSSKGYPESAPIPALLLKPPMLSSHKRVPSEDQNIDFDGFDGVYIQSTQSPSTSQSNLPTFSDQQAFPKHSDPPTPAHAEINKNANNNIQRQQSPSLQNANTMPTIPSVNSEMPVAQSSPTVSTVRAVPSAVDDDEILSPASSHYSVSNSIQESPIDSPTPYSFQNSTPNQIEPRPRPTQMQNRALLPPIITPHASDTIRSPLNSPSAAAAAIASASLKSQLKIGTVKVVESQQAQIELGNTNFYAGEEGFSAQDYSAESSQLNSDNEDSLSPIQTYTANPISAHPEHPPATGSILRVNSGSDSSYVNVQSNTDADSLSSGVVVRPESFSTVATPTHSSHPNTVHPYRTGYDSDDDDQPTRAINAVSSPSPDVAANSSLSAQTAEPVDSSLHYDHQRYGSAISDYSTSSTFMSEYEEKDADIKLYHPQPHRPTSGMPNQDTSKLRASVISTASSNILESSGGIPNLEVLSITDKASVQTDLPDEGDDSEQANALREHALNHTQAQLVQGGSSTPGTRQSMPLLQRRPSNGRSLSAYMAPHSDFRKSHMVPPTFDQDGEPGTFYPAPIPVELKLPPLLSKKNLTRAKAGRPISRRPGSFMRPGSMAFPPPPVWNVDSGVSGNDRRSMMSRRLSSASTLNAFNQNLQQRKSGEFDEGLEDDRTSMVSSKASELKPSDGEDMTSTHSKDKGKGVSAPIHEDDEGEEHEGEGEDDEQASIMSPISGEGKVGELRDESWGQPSWTEARYSESLLDYYEGGEGFDEDEDDGIQSDCATLQSDEEYQEDILIDEEETEKLTAEARKTEQGMMMNSNIDDFAFTSFNPNSAITDRGLLANSISYSSGMVPAVGIQPPSLIEELEMRKAGRKARLQRVYYDSNTGNAIATETIGRNAPAPEQLIREPHSGHPLDARHSKSLLELQHIANQDYEDQKMYRHNIHAAVETDRISRMGFSTANLVSPSMAQFPTEVIEEGDPNESLGARRARLKKKRQEEAEAAAATAAEEQYQNETLAERRARLKKEKQLLKQQKEQLTLNPPSSEPPVNLDSAAPPFIQQPSAIVT